MIKRTLYFGNPAYLRQSNQQLIVELPETEETKSIPIEDIGVVVLDNQQVTISQSAMEWLLAHNAALITCDKSHHPVGMMLNLSGHTIQSARFQAQLEASIPLKKQLWQQTITCKITNQAALLNEQKVEVGNMHRWAEEVNSGDTKNLEARAAVYYWKKLFSQITNKQIPNGQGDTSGPEHIIFDRDRFGDAPNNLLNYGYSILRAIVARGLVASGLLPTLGIHHRNQYNAYCLADDIMEPYRPFVDRLVLTMVLNGENIIDLTPSIKKQLLAVPVLDVMMEGQRSPLMVAMQRTTASLAQCFEGEMRKIIYPEWCETE